MFPRNPLRDYVTALVADIGIPHREVLRDGKRGQKYAPVGPMATGSDEGRGDTLNKRKVKTLARDGKQNAYALPYDPPRDSRLP